jgi:hypothetical protein
MYSVCKIASYCSRECRVADWKRHKLTCNKIEKVSSEKTLSQITNSHKFRKINLEKENLLFKLTENQTFSKFESGICDHRSKISKT